MIFAAGLGTRLRPLTDRMPKALVPVDGKPLLEHLILKMKAAGYTDITINIHHFADQIVRFLEDKNNFDLTIHLSDERDLLLETGGGIRHAQALLQENAEGEPVLIHNVDILSNINLQAFARVHQPCSAATLLVSHRETSRYLLFDHDNCLVGWINTKTREIKSPYPGLDIDRCKRYAFSGIHLFSQHLFPMLADWPDKFSIIDFYLSVADRMQIKACVKENLRLLDIGKPDALAKAADFLKEISVE